MILLNLLLRGTHLFLNDKLLIIYLCSILNLDPVVVVEWIRHNNDDVRLSPPAGAVTYGIRMKGDSFLAKDSSVIMFYSLSPYCSYELQNKANLTTFRFQIRVIRRDSELSSYSPILSVLDYCFQKEIYLLLRTWSKNWIECLKRYVLYTFLEAYYHFFITELDKWVY